MTGEVGKHTFGEKFLLDVQAADSRGLLFSVLQKAAARFYPQENLEITIKDLSDFVSVATYRDKLARVRIEYNGRAVREIHCRLVGLHNFGEDNYKYKEKMIRKLNLLINNHPPLEELAYIVVSAYIIREYGKVEDFKREITTYLQESLV